MGASNRTLSMQGRVNDAYESFFHKYKQAYNDAFPLHTETNSKNNILRKPWMTSGLLKSTKKQNQLYANYLKNPSSDNKKSSLYTVTNSKLQE